MAIEHRKIHIYDADHKERCQELWQDDSNQYDGADDLGQCIVQESNSISKGVVYCTKVRWGRGTKFSTRQWYQYL
jgi:hypothetical protein